jgi:hypothetical protein
MQHRHRQQNNNKKLSREHNNVEKFHSSVELSVCKQKR